MPVMDGEQRRDTAPTPPDRSTLERLVRQQALVLDAAAEGIISIDCAGMMTFANPAASRLTGNAHDDLVGRPFHAVLHHAYADGTPYPDVASPVLAVLQDGAVHQVSGEVFWRRDGSSFPCEYVCAPICEEGGVIGAVILFQDSTTRQEAAELQAVLLARANAAEARFRSLLESAPDAIVITDRTGRIVLVNRLTEVAFGYQREELLGQPIELLVPLRYRQGHVRQRERYAVDPHTRPMGAGLDLYAQRKDGTVFPTEISLSPVQSDGERLIIAVVRDISERRRVSDALRESEERFRLLVQDVKDYAIFLLTPEGAVASWNAGAERLLGYPELEILGQHFRRFYLAEDVAAGKPEEELREAAREGRCLDEGERLRRDGTRFWANTVITALRDPHRQLRGFAKVTRDVTAQHELERQKDEFLANVSHDLRTPLGAITTSIGAVLANAPPDLAPRLHRLLVNIDGAAARMAQLVDDLLELTRLQASRVQLRLERVDLRLLAQRAARTIEPMAEARGQRLELVLPKRALWAVVDGARLERALLNLMSNAQKYGRDGGLIRLVLRRHAGERRFLVTDDGPGIAPAEQERIFDRFYRAPTAGFNQGSGLGLPIARGMVELHGGQLWVESTPGLGSTFVLAVPASPVARAPTFEAVN